MIYILLMCALVAFFVIFLLRIGRKQNNTKPQRPPRQRNSTGIRPDPMPERITYDPTDPSIGDPRKSMRELSWIQSTVLAHAADGLVICYAEPGRSHSQTDKEYFHQKRTIDSLVRAGFLQPIKPGKFGITPLGMKALDALPQKSN